MTNDISSKFLWEATSGLERPQAKDSPKYIITVLLLDDYQVEDNFFKLFTYFLQGRVSSQNDSCEQFKQLWQEMATAAWFSG